MISNASLTKESVGARPDGAFVRFRQHLVSAGTQTTLDISVLAAAFVVAYLLRLDFQIPRNRWHYLLVQIPFVVLLQFSRVDLCRRTRLHLALHRHGAHKVISLCRARFATGLWRCCGERYLPPIRLGGFRFQLVLLTAWWLSAGLSDCRYCAG